VPTIGRLNTMARAMTPALPIASFPVLIVFRG
jgi:hypothetical protein